ncbi:conserved hypothetical protein [Ricinus communis]|uniref:Uncharacterized protein n=1 Tax=Ricinus communis TaxID=3988 RepID=B9TLN6_RICCO|nr:conserved hypothetical protein [Ricinus communis]
MAHPLKEPEKAMSIAAKSLSLLQQRHAQGRQLLALIRPCKRRTRWSSSYGAPACPVACRGFGVMVELCHCPWCCHDQPAPLASIPRRRIARPCQGLTVFARGMPDGPTGHSGAVWISIDRRVQRALCISADAR